MGGRHGTFSGMGRSRNVPSSKSGDRAAWPALTPTLEMKAATPSMLTVAGRMPRRYRGVAQSGQSIGLQNRGPRVRILPPLPFLGGAIVDRHVLAAAGVVCTVGVLVFAVAAYGATPVPINNAECTIYPADGSSPQTGYCTGTVNLNPASSSQSDSSPVNTNPVTRGRSFPWAFVAAGVILALALAVIVLTSRKRPRHPRRKRLRSTHQ